MKYIADASMDAALNHVADHGNRLHLLSQAPGLTGGVVNYADIATYSLGFVVLTTGVGNGAYTLQDGAVSGRRLTLAQQTVPGTGHGVATHAAIIDTVNAVVKMVDTAPSYNMAPAVNQTVPSFDVWEIEDPT